MGGGFAQPPPPVKNVFLNPKPRKDLLSRRFAVTAYADALPDGDEKGGSKTSLGSRKEKTRKPKEKALLENERNINAWKTKCGGKSDF